MATDRYGGPAAIGAVKAAGAAAQAGAAGLAASLRSPTMPMQAGILSRPPDLLAGTATHVTGTLGAPTPEGDLPLATSAGPVLLRPVPGAWPADLAPGSSVSITIGPGARASNVQALATPERAPSVATGTRPPVGGAEVALRGLLAAGTDATVQTTNAPRPVISTSSAVAATVATNAQPQAATTPSTNPQLLASAGSMQPPRPGPAIAAAPIQEPGPGIAAAQRAQAVPDIAKGARAGTQDLQQQAALAQQGDTLSAKQAGVAPLAELPLPDLLSPLPQDAAATQPDLVLAQALAHPGMVARMAAFLPRGDRLGGAALMLYLFGARNGGVRAWLGEEQMRHLTRSEAAALAEIEEGMVPVKRMASDGSVWTTLLVPFLEGDRPSVMLLATNPGLSLPPDPDSGPEGQEGEEVTATAFTLGMDLSALGPVQLRGLSLPDRVMLDLSIALLPPPALRDFFEHVVDKALAGLEVRSSLRLHWGRGPFMAELMPDGARVTCERNA
ncbi:hypothetical protein [Niveispirillum sp. KHB5.9]|uniref:hypothetical protein n=1 Tax=Niveispirillum sp. KHB5.9 TaxID=3400269 RepID=UPI003A8C527E